jgi:hypothetical protein
VDPWNPFPAHGKDSFEGDAAVPWRLVRDAGGERWRQLGFAPPRVRRVNALGYLAPLGFRPQSLLPLRLAAAAAAVDRAARPLAPLLALRAELVWDRRAA